MNFSDTKNLFSLPEGIIYLDGNSLGPLPKAALDCATRTLNDEWGKLLITGWNKAGWMAKPSDQGNRIAKLIGAPDGSVVLGDTLSIKVYQAVASALELRPDRKKVLSDTGNFPTDLYMVDGLVKSLKQGHTLECVAPEDVFDALDESVAVLMLTQVDYRTGRLHDMAALTKKAHEMGIITVWDLAHSAGAIPVDVLGCDVDFAIGCTYKYLNGGPGAPAFIYVAPKHLDVIEPALSGWLGHEAPFAFDLDYRPGGGIERMRVGTPPIIQIATLEAALDVWDSADIHEVRAKSIELSQLFIELVEASCPELTLASPRDPYQRGSQVSFSFEHGYAAMQAVIAQGLIGDFRAPDIMRFGFTPLYIDENDVRNAANIIENTMKNRLWDNPIYQTRSKVT